LSLRRDVRILRDCLITITLLACITAGVMGATILAPMAIAVVLTLVLAPVAHRMESWGVPAGFAAVLTVVGVSAIAGMGATTLAPSFTAWVHEAPQMVQTVERKLRPLKQSLLAVENVSKRITAAATVTPVRTVTPSVVMSGDGTTDGIVFSALRTAPDILAKIVFVIILTIFLLAYRRYYSEQLIMMPRTLRNRLRMARIVRDVRNRVSTYLFTLALINIGLALVTATCFWLAGIANAILWGIAFGILNFIPVLGPTTIVIAAAIMGFATGKTITDSIAPPLILLALDTVEANLVQPWLLSRRIIIGPIAIFLTVAALVLMWGPAASITAVPMLILLHTVAQHVPSLRPIAVLLATEKVRHAARDHREHKRTHHVWRIRKRRQSDLEAAVETAVPFGEKSLPE
jgi:predicted PurR-regulated permease PerM